VLDRPDRNRSPHPHRLRPLRSWRSVSVAPANVDWYYLPLAAVGARVANTGGWLTLPFTPRR